LATQRLSKLHKDAAAECNNKLIGRTGLDIDMKRASEELGFTSKQQYLSLRSLDAGEFFAFGPAISTEIKKIKIGAVNTTHPEAGSKISLKTTPPTKKIKQILKKLADLPEEAKKELNTISEFKSEIFRLNTVIAKSKINKEMGVKKEDIEKAVAVVQEKNKEYLNKIETYYQDRINRFITAFDEIKSIMDEEASPYNKYKHPNFDKGKFNKVQNIKVDKELYTPITPVFDKNKVIGAYRIRKGFLKEFKKDNSGKISSFEPPVYRNNFKDNNSEDKPLTGGAFRMLHVLVSKYPIKLSKVQLATFSRLKSSSGTFGTYMSILKNRNFLEIEGNNYSASQEGIDYIGADNIRPPQTTQEIIAQWQNILKGGARRMFDALVDKHPYKMTKGELGEITGLSPNSGTFTTYLSILKSNNLIEIHGQEIMAANNLFL
jgi:hypothetical protein